MYTRNVWIIMWGDNISLHLFKADCFHLLSNKGTNIIETNITDFYRFISACELFSFNY